MYLNNDTLTPGLDHTKINTDLRVNLILTLNLKSLTHDTIHSCTYVVYSFSREIPELRCFYFHQFLSRAHFSITLYFDYIKEKSLIENKVNISTTKYVHYKIFYKFYYHPLPSCLLIVI